MPRGWERVWGFIVGGVRAEKSDSGTGGSERNAAAVACLFVEGLLWCEWGENVIEMIM